MGNCVSNNNIGGSWIWIIILLFLCGGCGNGFIGGENNENCECSWIIILILLLCCCGNSNHCTMCEA